MREFVFYSKDAVTAGNFVKDDLKQSGRLDIICNTFISFFFISNAMRPDVRVHFIFDGPPHAPQHLVFTSTPDMPISKKDVAGLIKRMLYKSPNAEGLKEIFPGCAIEKKSFEALIKELDALGRNIFLLDARGTDIRNLKLKGNEVFVMGDHDGFPKDKKRFLKQIDAVTVGPETLFASQVITLIHNEIDRATL